MDENKKSIKIYGILFIILAIADIVMLAINYFSGELKKVWNLKVEGLPEGFINGFMIGFLTITLLVVIVKLFLGIRAIQQSKGTCKGKGHITLATVMLVISIISVVLSLPGIKLETSTIINFLDELVTIIILIDYIRIGKKLINDK